MPTSSQPPPSVNHRNQQPPQLSHGSGTQSPPSPTSTRPFAPDHAPPISSTDPSLSPTLRSSEFVFPSRPVYQGRMSDFQGSSNSGYSHKTSDVEESDIGLDTITQMLQKDKEADQLKPRPRPGAATYHGKHDREQRMSTSSAENAPAPHPQHGASTMVGKLSTPYSTDEGDERQPSLGFDQAFQGLDLSDKEGQRGEAQGEESKGVDPGDRGLVEQLEKLGPINQDSTPRDSSNPTPTHSSIATPQPYPAQSPDPQLDRKHRSHDSPITVDADESGEPSLVSDLSGIVRLGNLGWDDAGPNPRAKHAARQVSVKDFVNDQAQTTNMQDPNALGLADEEGVKRGEAAGQEKDTQVHDQFEEPQDEPALTARFQHVMTEEGHHVINGREGVLKKCEDEPITTPGAVQGFGVLMVLEEDEESGKLAIRQVSENSSKILGLSPKYLFQLDCFTRLLTNEQHNVLRDMLEYLPDPSHYLSEEAKKDATKRLVDQGPLVFLLSGFGEPGSSHAGQKGTASSSSAHEGRRQWTSWVAAHRPQDNTLLKVDEQQKPVPPSNIIILEFELEKDSYNPPFPTPEDTPSVPRARSYTTDSESARGTGATAGSNSSATSSDQTAPVHPAPPTPKGAATAQTPTPAEPSESDEQDEDIPAEKVQESTTNRAVPLQALERMRGQLPDKSGSARPRTRPIRSRPPGGSGTMDTFAVMSEINEQLGAAPDLETFLDVTVGLVQDVSRFHRVMLYQFDEAMHGVVVSELADRSKMKDLYRGLRFPAADIPPQARELYKINKVRMLYDRHIPTARMVLKYREDLDYPLDMTHSYLRAMSPIHLQYLANMGARSSMSISIMAFGQLWGLIACHSSGKSGMRVSFPFRQMLRLLSESISKNIERLSYAQRLKTRKIISTVPSINHPTGYIVSNADDLLQIFQADAGLLVIGDGCKLLGRQKQGPSMMAIAEYLRAKQLIAVKASSSLVKDFPDLTLPKTPDTAAGLLYIPLSYQAGQDFIVFLRRGQVREVQWAGKPTKDEASEGANLEPRLSFDLWVEQVMGTTRVWSDDQLESAGVLALIYGKFIQVWREKQTAMASSQLTAILLTNTSHAVRTPLSQIINTLELALSGTIDKETRDMLQSSHDASRSLLFHVHDLLDLTRIETGNETTFRDPFDLRQSITEAVRLYETEISRRGVEFRVKTGDDLPKFVVGDSKKVRTVISNLVANSVKFTSKGFIEVYCGVRSQTATSDDNEPSDRTVNIEIVISDSGCGIANDKLQAMFLTLEGSEESSQDSGVGLGLAVVARIVEQLQGQLRAESEEGIGTRILFSLPMKVHDPTRPNPARSRDSRSTSKKTSTRKRRSSTKSKAALRFDRSHVPDIDSFVQDLQSNHLCAAHEDDERLEAAGVRMSQPGSFPVADSSFPVMPAKLSTEAEALARSPSPERHNVRQGSLRFRRESSDQSSDQSSQPFPQSYSQTSTVPSPASSPKNTVTPSDSKPSASPKQSEQDAEDKSQLRVMVVEDDVINSQILQKRLKMDKHLVVAVTNGQECVDFLRNDRDIDAILMDIQMPIMDGRTAAREIRKLERSESKPPSDITPLLVDGRIPLFAVSASLYESDRTNLSENFDGWLLKPLDSSRMRAILAGLQDPSKRSEEVYKQGNWEAGGYFRGPESASSSPSSSHASSDL
ncbi:hypothetical protein L198_02568 [Cryptococcus wingfieldii CBS 7118]|uniref:Bacteriophytochrome histidine kinase n=1 Tax=Cryptococcus wingfieldii CBS 7118 TaxID=1295528 RepID=A0A1E3JLT2_9TREE|nr:hypothetical protein L198_02568 [Cryptococcus wingfieldii CBS 7118]ODO01841.1 hypothetical protein L198_02568 [Cryptococcus wingfieldii CBS 7118]